MLLALAAWLVLSWSHLIGTILNYYNPFPIWDYWHVVTDLNDIESLHLGVLWQQHNDHRIVFPELVFAADMLLMRGLEILPLVVSFLCYIAIWVIIARSLIADARLPVAVSILGILLAGLILAWRGVAQVVGVPFLLQWALLQASALASLWFISRVQRSRSGWRLAAGICCAVVANYTAANGLPLWLILIATALILKFSRKQVAVLAICGAASIGAFFIGYHSSGNLNLSNFWNHPVYSIEFLLSYLSVPFGLIQPPWVGICFGAISITAFLLLLITAIKNRLLATETGIVLFGTYIFTLITAVMISSGRMNPNDPTFLAGKAERFVSIPLVTWAILLAIALWVPAVRGRRVVSYAAALVMVVLLLKVLPRTRVWVQSHDNTIRQQQWATLSIENGIFDPELVRRIYPDPSLVAIALPSLKKYRVSIYSFAYSKWLSRSAQSEFNISDAGSAPGAVTQVYPLLGGLEVMGWAEGAERETYFPKILFVDDTGRIIGFGRRLKLGLPVGLASARTPSSIAWVGFVKQPAQAHSFSAYVIDRRTRTIRGFGSPVRFPAIEAAESTAAGAAVPDVNWTITGAWTKGLIPPGADAGTAPSNFIASWSGNDANTGSIISTSLAAPAGHCVILPVLHGPVADDLYASLVDADTNQILATVPMEGAGTQWRYWRVKLESGVSRFRVEAADHGVHWGEWLAVGVPSECR